MSDPRIAIWVQHLLGTGHLRRALLLAEALAARGARVVLASGGPSLPWSLPAGVQLVQLPAIRAADAHFSALATAGGEPVSEELWAERRVLLENLLRTFRPRVFVTEHWPFGRGAFARELEPLLERAQAEGVALVASVRDVLVSKPDPRAHARMLARAAPFARVLVHGDPSLLPFCASFPAAAALGDRLIHTGYLAPRSRPVRERTREILVSAGGGAVGRSLRAVAVAAARLTAHRPWRIVGGPAAEAQELAALAADAPPGVVIDGHRADLADLLARAAVSVSQAGYNTVVEALAAGTPMVLVPFADGREDEQTRRAEALAARGSAWLLPERSLTPRALARTVTEALAAPAIVEHGIRLDGAARAAEAILELVR